MTNTRKRIDPKESTQFGMWLREQPELDSKTKHLVCTAGFFIWRNYNTGQWMLIQSKRAMKALKRSQKNLLKVLHNAIDDRDYYGIYLVEFENTHPDDGDIYLNKEIISRSNFIKFMQFSMHYEFYATKNVKFKVE